MDATATAPATSGISRTEGLLHLAGVGAAVAAIALLTAPLANVVRLAAFALLALFCNAKLVCDGSVRVRTTLAVWMAITALYGWSQVVFAAEIELDTTHAAAASVAASAPPAEGRLDTTRVVAASVAASAPPMALRPTNTCAKFEATRYCPALDWRAPNPDLWGRFGHLNLTLAQQRSIFDATMDVLRSGTDMASENDQFYAPGSLAGKRSCIRTVVEAFCSFAFLRCTGDCAPLPPCLATCESTCMDTKALFALLEPLLTTPDAAWWETLHGLGDAGVFAHEPNPTCLCCCEFSLVRDCGQRDNPELVEGPQTGDDDKQLCSTLLRNLSSHDVIVSIGSNNEFGFEEHMLSCTSNHIAIFDCTVSNVRRDVRPFSRYSAFETATNKPNSTRVSFHPFCIGETDDRQFRTWDSIARISISAAKVSSKDSRIAIEDPRIGALKMVEGWERLVLPLIMRAAPRHRPPQISVELRPNMHKTMNLSGFVDGALAAPRSDLGALRMAMDDGGYTLVDRNDNSWCSHCAEVVFVESPTPNAVAFLGDSTMGQIANEYRILKNQTCTPTASRCSIVQWLSPERQPLKPPKRQPLPGVEGPVGYGLEHPGCSDCSSCGAQRCGRITYFPIEFSRDVEFITQTHATSQALVGAYIREHPFALCVVNSGLHDLMIANITDEQYVENVWYYLEQLAGCSKVIWLHTNSVRGDAVRDARWPQTNERIMRLNRLVQEDSRILGRIDHLIDTYELSTKFSHRDNVHLEDAYSKTVAFVLHSHAYGVGKHT